MIAKVVALVQNDTSITLSDEGNSLVRPKEVAAVANLNASLLTMMPDIVALMDFSMNETDQEAWVRFSALAQTLGLNEDSVLPPKTSGVQAMQPTAPARQSVLQTAFTDARRRRTNDMRAQTVFEELISTVDCRTETCRAYHIFDTPICAERRLPMSA